MLSEHLAMPICCDIKHFVLLHVFLANTMTLISYSICTRGRKAHAVSVTQQLACVTMLLNVIAVGYGCVPNVAGAYQRDTTQEVPMAIPGQHTTTHSDSNSAR